MFDTTTNEHVVYTSKNLSDGEVDGLLARATHSVELDTRHVLAPASDHRRDPPEVQSLLADRGHTAIDDVLNVVLSNEALCFFSATRGSAARSEGVCL
jgi:hypothetical protein